MASDFLLVGVDHSPHIEPGEYEAHCVAAHEPFEYKQFNRLVKRLDFVIHGSGEVLKKYLNLGPVAAPWKTLSSRSEYYKVWVASMGRKPKLDESISLDHIVGNAAIRFKVTVEDKKHQDDGYVYSVIGKVSRLVSNQRNEPEYYSVPQGLKYSGTQALNDSSTQSLSYSGTQDGFVNKSLEAVDSGTQDVGRAETQALSYSGTQDGKFPLQRAEYRVNLSSGKPVAVTPETIAAWQALYPNANVDTIVRSWASTSQREPFESVENVKATLLHYIKAAHNRSTDAAA